MRPNPLAEYAQDVGKEPVILTVAGKPVAALVAIEDADLETVALSTHPQFLALIERSRARQKIIFLLSSIRNKLGINLCFQTDAQPHPLWRIPGIVFR